MIKIKDYVRVGSLEEAYELNQKRSACILGGMLWTKMGQRQVQTAIDLSGLGLDQIEESEEEFSIGCMVTLRQMEEHEGLNAYTDGAARESVPADQQPFDPIAVRLEIGDDRVRLVGQDDALAARVIGICYLCDKK